MNRIYEHDIVKYSAGNIADEENSVETMIMESEKEKTKHNHEQNTCRGHWEIVNSMENKSIVCQRVIMKRTQPDAVEPNQEYEYSMWLQDGKWQQN